MSKHKFLRKLSFLLALVMVMTSLCVPVMADTEEPAILGTGTTYTDTRTGLEFEVSDGTGYAIIVGPYDLVKENLTIPQKVYNRGGSSFDVAEIKEYAFEDNVNLTGKLTITGGIRSLLKDVDLSVGRNAFNGCTGLTSLVIGPYTEVIDDDDDPFEGCTGLMKITNNSDIWNSGEGYDQRGKRIYTGLVKIPANNEGKKWYDSKDTEHTRPITEVITGQTAVREDYDPQRYTVTFWDWDGEAYNYEYDELAQTVIEDGKAKEPAELKNSEWVFDAWYTEYTPEGGLSGIYDFDLPVTEDLKLYAGWKKKAGSGVLFRDEKDSGFLFTINEDGETATIARNFKDDPIDITYTLINEDIVIPEVVSESNKEYTVTGVGDSAFEGKGYTGKLEFPDTLTDIGDRAFYGCKDLTGDLVFPEGLKTIGDSAFMMPTQDSKLSGTLYFGSSLVSIGNSAFEYCDGFTGDLVLPDTVESVGDYAFSGCTGFEGKIKLGNRLKTIGKFAFAANNTRSNFTGGIEIPATVTSIGDYAFYNGQALEGTLVIPLSGNLVSIGKYAFADCSKLKGNITFPQTLKTIGDDAFKDCKGLTGNLVIPDGVTVIGGGAFSSCTGLGETLTIGESVERVDKHEVSGTYMTYQSFSYCSGIKRVINKSDKVEVDLEYIVINNETWTDAAGNTIKTIGKGVAYRSDYTGERIDPNDPNNPGGSVSGNVASDVKEEEIPVEGIEGADKVKIVYPHKIPFFGKSKIGVEYFTKDGAKFTVSFNGQEYAVTKIKVNKKKKKIQITNLENADKKAVKAIKKATKGESGLDYDTAPYVVSDSDNVIVKFNKKLPDTIKSAKVMINNKYFNIKNKNDCLVFNPVVNAVTFKHDDVIGSSTTFTSK